MDSFDLEELPYPALVSAVEKMSPRELFILTNFSPFIYLQVKNSVRPVIQIELRDNADARKKLTFYEIMLERFPKTKLVLVLKLKHRTFSTAEQALKMCFASHVIYRFPKTRVVIEDPNSYNKTKYLGYLKLVVYLGYSDLFMHIADTMTVADLQSPFGADNLPLLEFAEDSGKDKIAEYLRGRIANDTLQRLASVGIEDDGSPESEKEQATAGRSMYVI